MPVLDGKVMLGANGAVDITNLWTVNTYVNTRYLLSTHLTLVLQILTINSTTNR